MDWILAGGTEEYRSVSSERRGVRASDVQAWAAEHSGKGAQSCGSAGKAEGATARDGPTRPGTATVCSTTHSALASGVRGDARGGWWHFTPLPRLTDGTLSLERSQACLRRCRRRTTRMPSSRQRTAT